MTQSSTPTVAASVLAAFVGAIQDTFGKPRAAFLGEIQLEASTLRGANARIPLDELGLYLERAMVTLDDPALGLHWAERLQVAAFAPVSHLLTSTGTLRKGFELLDHFAPLFIDAQVYAVLEQDDELSIEVSPGLRFRSLAADRFLAEMLLGGMLKMIRGSFSPSASPRRATFAYAAPPHSAEYERILGCPVLFEQPSSSLVLDRELLDLRSPYADRETHSALRAVAEQRLTRVNNKPSASVRVRAYLIEKLPLRVSMQGAADKLGLSERTLRRHLEEEGTSFREIENVVLEEAAKHMLCDRGMTIKETASAMGFADVASFHRAFKAWTGLTPTEYRDQR